MDASTKSQVPDVPSPPARPGVALTLAIAFLAFCGGVPLVQAAREIFVQKRAPLVLDLFQRLPGKATLHGWDSAQCDNSWLAERVRNPMLQLRWDLFRDAGSKALVGKDDWLFYAPDIQYLARPSLDDSRFYQGRFDTIFKGRRVFLEDPTIAIVDFRNQLKAMGIELLVVPVPTKASIHPYLLNPQLRQIPSSPTLVLIDRLRRAGVPTVDLFHPMLAHSAHPLYLRQDTHWNPDGVSIAANVISDTIKQRIAPPSVPYHFTLHDTAISRWGDIAEMTKLPRRHEIWGNQKIQISKVVDTQGHPYHDASGARILWLGDSYSRIYQTDAPGSAGIIARVAQRLEEPLQSIVNDGGASIKVRETLARHPERLRGVKLVVWEFVERDIRFGEGGWRPVNLSRNINGGSHE